MRRGFTLIEVMIVIAMLAILVAIAVPNLISARKNANEAGAIASLKVLQTAQGLFREQDIEGDGETDYATSLGELGNSVLIDPELAAGLKSGYRINLGASTAQPLYLWFATADPTNPGGTGDRYFCTNHLGVITFTTLASIPLDTNSCALPAGTIPLGR